MNGTEITDIPEISFGGTENKVNVSVFGYEFSSEVENSYEVEYTSDADNDLVSYKVYVDYTLGVMPGDITVDLGAANVPVFSTGVKVEAVAEGDAYKVALAQMGENGTAWYAGEDALATFKSALATAVETAKVTVATGEAAATPVTDANTYLSINAKEGVENAEGSHLSLSSAVINAVGNVFNYTTTYKTWYGVTYTFTAQRTEDPTALEGLTIDYYYGPTASHDLMTDEYTRSYTAASPDASPVQFTFEHLLSRVGIAVKSTSSDVTLTSLVFKGMSVLGAYNTPGSQGQWQLLTSIPELSNVQPGSFTADLSDISAPLPSDGTSVPVLSDLLLIPQTPGDDANGLDPITITATYSVGGAAPETKELTLPADPAWQPGRHYRYTLTLGTTDVTLNIDVVDWEPAEDNNITW